MQSYVVSIDPPDVLRFLGKMTEFTSKRIPRVRMETPYKIFIVELTEPEILILKLSFNECYIIKSDV